MISGILKMRPNLAQTIHVYNSIEKSYDALIQLVLTKFEENTRKYIFRDL